MPAPRGLGTINADDDASLGSEGWKVGGSCCKAYKDGRTTTKERRVTRCLSGLSWATAASPFGPGNNPWAKIARFATPRKCASRHVPCPRRRCRQQAASWAP